MDGWRFVGNSWAKSAVLAHKLRGTPNKYHAIPTVVDNIRFSSKKEAERYKALKLLQQAGEITDLTLQPSYKLVVNDLPICVYRADFEYIDRAGNLHVEDVKGLQQSRAYDLFRLKAKLLLATQGLTVETI